MARIYLYIFIIWTLTCCAPAIRGVNSDLGVGIAVDQAEPDTVIAQKASDLLLNCSVTLSSDLGSDLEISWLKDGVPVNLSNKRTQLLENGSLYIRRVIHRPRKNRTDEGNYRCLATVPNVGQVIARDVRVQVAGIERKFDVEPEPQETVVGGVARLECSIQAVPPPIYIWEFNKNALPQLEENRYFLLTSGILQITGVRESDAGLYRCYAAQGSVHVLRGKVSDIDGKYSGEASLTVKPGGQSLDVKIVASSGNVTARVGSPATLECLVQGLDQPAEWRKDGKKITSSIDGRVNQYGDNLRFKATVLGDAGKYQCVAGRFASETVSLTVIKKPVIVNGPASVEKVPSQWQYLNCDAEGHPKPNITWFKDGKRLDLDDTSFNYRRARFSHQLAIVQSEPHNSGFYQCFATNAAGTTSAIARLKINVQEDAPGSVKNIRVLNVTSTTILIAWDSPVPDSPDAPIVLAYSVHYRKMNDRMDDTVSKSSPMLLTGLEPFCNYTVYIKAYTTAGAGPNSRPISVQTRESVPIEPVMVTMVPKATSINVSWTEMAPKLRRGVVVGYKLYYKTKDQADGEAEVVIPASARSHVLKDLVPETEYKVRMVAGTALGFPQFSVQKWPWVNVRTEQTNDVPDPPSMLILPINATAVNATWSLRGGDADVKHFILKLERLPSQEMIQPVNLSSKERFYVLYRLDEKVRYELTLVVKTSDDSEAMVTKEFQTSNLPMVPSPVDLRVSPMSDGTSLQVTWFQPSTEYEIEYFTVKYIPLDGKGAVYTLKSYTNSALITGLQENTVYNISVSAQGQIMRSLFSTSILGPTNKSSNSPMEGSSEGTNEQRLGIVIGVSIGLFCIVICILIIVLRNRCLTPNYNQQPMTQPARFHGNGHIPGNGNGHAVTLQENRRSVGVYEMDAYTPMLDHLPENEDSDSKGGGGGNVILTANGAKLNGFVPMKKNGVRNGQNHNGHMVSVLPAQYNGETVDSEETRGLIVAMLSGGNGGQCMTGRMGEDSFTTSRLDDLGSLDGIDHSSCEDMLRASQVRAVPDDDDGIDHSSCEDMPRASQVRAAPDDEDDVHNDSGCSPGRSGGHLDSGSLPLSPCDTEKHESGLLTQTQWNHSGVREDSHPPGRNIPHSVRRHDDDATSPTSGTTGDTSCSGVGDSQATQLPHNQLSTSIKTQASGLRGCDPDYPVTRGSSSTTPQLPPTGVVIATGSSNPVVVQDRDCRNLDDKDPMRGHRHRNGVSPQLVSNGGIGHQPQGVSRLVLNNPTVPQSALTRETTLSHGSRDVTLGTVAQPPQDAALSAMVMSSPRKHHYQV